MGNIDTSTTGRTDEILDDSEQLDLLQKEAAQNADRIASFTTRMHSMVQRAVEAGHIQNEAEADRRLEIVDAVTRGHDDIRLDTMPDEAVLGYNTIGGGRTGIHVNRTTLAGIASDDERKEMTQVIVHEEAHGDQVELVGKLKIDGKEIDDLLLYEGHAEVNGNEGAGMSMTDHREGQPEEVYGEGQRLAVMIIRKAGREAFEKAMTKDGDLSALQGAMAA